MRHVHSSIPAHQADAPGGSEAANSTSAAEIKPTQPAAADVIVSPPTDIDRFHLRL
jgi:hypothetical protein